MTKKQKQQNWILAGIAILILFLLSKGKSATRQASVRYSTTGTLTPDILAEMYNSLIQDTTRTFITDEALGIVDMPWQNDLAHSTKNYFAVQQAYYKYYGKNLTTELIAWMTPPELSSYVAELLTVGQVMLP